ncbi:MAG: hypothetical protein HC900_04930 [Methylacidiphilales bacterium]|nr:hypothetical protein [Candidatus Methylacidiphilales bacterium]
MTLAISYAARIGLALVTTAALAVAGEHAPSAGGAEIGDTCDASTCSSMAGLPFVENYHPAEGLAAGTEVRPAASMTLVIPVGRNNPAPKCPEMILNTLGDLAEALAGCWSPPPIDEVANPPDAIFQVSYRRNGTLFGRPRIIEFSRGVTTAERGIYYEAVARALTLCSSLPFSDALGGAVAGRTFRVVFKDQRNKRQALQ